MAETLFTFDKDNYHECQSSYRGSNNLEYYLGDYSIEGGSVIDVRADKKSVGACSIIRLRSKTNLSFRRTWDHIRKDATDVMVLWFVKQGSLSISHSGGKSVARAGDFAITKSRTPFFMECHAEDTVHEVLHVILPTHVFRRFIPSEVSNSFSVAAKGRVFSIIQNILTEVLDNNDELEHQIEQLLFDSAMSILSDTIKGYESLSSGRQTIAEQRLQEVLRYIELHLSDPKLSTTMVAEACGISTRYLSSLLKQNETSFSVYIWEQRLTIASQWLSSTSPKEISIAEIAFRVGFKSPAHFSRMFKRVYKKGPREYRADNMAGGTAENTNQEFFVGGTATTLQ